jgi:hypothetical protein
MVDLHCCCEESFFIHAGDTLMDAASQVMFHQESFELLDVLAHCTRPAKSIDTAVVLLNHLPTTARMSFPTAESLEYLWLVGGISFPARSST